MRYPSLDGPQRLITDPGFDQTPKPVSYWVDGLLAAIGGDGIIAPDEIAEIQRLQVGLQGIGQQRLASMGMNEQTAPPSNETSDFGASEGSEEMPGYEPEPGAEFTSLQ